MHMSRPPEWPFGASFGYLCSFCICPFAMPGMTLEFITFAY
jgi:hypothetical protein